MSYIIPTLHPAHILRGAPLTDIIAADLQKATRVAEHGPTQIENLVVVHPSSPVGLHAAAQCAGAWMDQWMALKCPVAVDVETSGLDFMGTALYSIALSGQDGYNTAVTFTLEDLRTLPWEVEGFVVTKLRQVLADPEITTVYHNAPFDYAVLTQHGFAVNGPVWDTQGFAHLVQPDIPKDLGWVGHTYLDVEPWKLNHEGRKQAQTTDILELLVYNAKDALNTMKLINPLSAEMYDRGLNAELMSYQMAFAKLSARMETYGIPIDHAVRGQIGERLRNRVHANLAEMRRYLNWEDFGPRRPTHIREALFGNQAKSKYNVLGLSPTKFTPAEQAPSSSYKAIIDHIEHPFVRAFITYIEDTDTYARLFQNKGDTSIDPKGKAGGYDRAIYPDGRLHVKWNPCGQKGSRFSSSPNCFDGETEVLTEDGWLLFPKAIKQARDNKLRFAQYDPKTEKITFAKATDTYHMRQKAVLQVQSQQIDLCGTPNHRMLLREYNPNKHDREAHVLQLKDLPQHLRFVHAGQYKFGKVDIGEGLLRLIVACQADGSWTKKAIRFDFKSKRKYDRLRWLLDAVSANYTTKERPKAEKHRYGIYICTSNLTSLIRGYIGPEREWDAWILDVTRKNAEVILDEIPHWDGSFIGDRRMYYSRKKTNVNWIQILAILLGHRATVLDAGTCWRVSISDKKAFSSARVKTLDKGGIKDVYCVSVPKGFIIVRRKGKAVIVGNCQNVALKYRYIFGCAPGRALVGADKDQLELRIIACRAGVRELVEEMSRPGADPHRLAAMNVFGEEFHQRSPEEQQNLRNMVKNVVYGALYNAGVFRVYQTIREKKELDVAMRAAMTQPVVTRIHRSYFGRYVEIPAYHEKNFAMASTLGYNECAPFGRRRYFPVQPPPFLEIGNWVTQTEGSDHVGRAMIHLQDDFDSETHGDAHIIVHGHDAIYAECAEGYAERAQFLMNHHFGDDVIEGPAGVVHLTAKASIGRNLKEVK